MNDERGIDTWRRVHNAYLQYAVDLGLPGLLLFVWLHLTCFRTARAVERAARNTRPCATCSRWRRACRCRSSRSASPRCSTRSPTSSISSRMAGLAVALKNTGPRADVLSDRDARDPQWRAPVPSS